MSSPANEIEAIVEARTITEVLHFTTDRGLLGILATGFVMSRDRLERDKYIEYILQTNCTDRTKDADWTDYVNMSISRVNARFLGISKKQWHNDGRTWWAVLAFEPSLLWDDGVYFTSTNNTYHHCVVRGQGAAGLEAMFAPKVKWGHFGSVLSRRDDMPAAYPTDLQAEVLYPGQLTVDRLRAIYVYDDDHIDHVYGLLSAFPKAPRVPVTRKPEVFQ